MTDAPPNPVATDSRDPVPPGVPIAARHKAPMAGDPAAVRHWFDGVIDDAIPEPDGTLPTARRTAAALARRAKADNTQRAYRAGVRAWCGWCAAHDLPALPADPADIAAFLAAQRYVPAGSDEKPLATNTLKLRLAAIAYRITSPASPPPRSRWSARPSPGWTAPRANRARAAA